MKTEIFLISSIVFLGLSALISLANISLFHFHHEFLWIGIIYSIMSFGELNDDASQIFILSAQIIKNGANVLQNLQIRQSPFHALERN